MDLNELKHKRIVNRALYLHTLYNSLRSMLKRANAEGVTSVMEPNVMLPRGVHFHHNYDLEGQLCKRTYGNKNINITIRVNTDNTKTCEMVSTLHVLHISPKWLKESK